MYSVSYTHLDVYKRQEADYVAREVQLQEEIDNIESSHPGYDEYRYDLGMIGHCLLYTSRCV